MQKPNLVNNAKGLRARETEANSGGQYNVENMQASNMARTEWLESQGFRILKFWNNEVSSNLDGVLKRIEETLAVHPLSSN